MNEDNKALEETVNDVKVEEMKRAQPQLIQQYDATDARTRGDAIQMHIVENFEQYKSEDMNPEEKIDAKIIALTDCLEELNEMIEACLSVNPPRVDIIKENINFYHGMILFKVNEFRDTDITSIETNFALRMIDFLNVSCVSIFLLDRPIILVNLLFLRLFLRLFHTPLSSSS